MTSLPWDVLSLITDDDSGPLAGVDAEVRCVDDVDVLRAPPGVCAPVAASGSAPVSMEL